MGPANRRTPHSSAGSDSALPVRGRPRRALFLLGALNLCALTPILLLVVANGLGPERWWGAALNLYLPQWIWAIAPLLLLPWTCLRARRLVAAPLLGLALTLSVLMGCCFPQEGASSGAGRLRVLTYNMDEAANPAGVLRELARAQADVIFLQEGRHLPSAMRRALADYQFAQVEDCLVLSRFPIHDVEGGRLPSVSYGSGWTACRVDWGPSVVSAYSVHLETPRVGLLALRDHPWSGGLTRFVEETRTRVAAARLLSQKLQADRYPTIVGGDLNAPASSEICRALQGSRLRDAFSAAGWGYGFTYGHDLAVGVSYTRIDHLLVSRPWRVEACWTGGADGSDHRPVLADLAWSP